MEREHNCYKLFLVFLIITTSYLSVNSEMSNKELCFIQEDFEEALENGRCWIIIEKKIYDLTNNNWWDKGNHLGYSCGDITTMNELGTKNIKLEDLIDYYGSEKYAPKVGKLCEKRSLEKAKSCGNGNCEEKENFINCPQDCPSGEKDGYCAAKWDFVCDPDCERKYDPECVCNRDGWCELEFENYTNCPNDCPPSFPDGFCYKRGDNFCDLDCVIGEDPDCVIEKPTTTSTISSTTTSTPTTLIILPTITTTTLETTKGGYLTYLPQLILGLIVTGG